MSEDHSEEKSRFRRNEVRRGRYIRRNVMVSKEHFSIQEHERSIVYDGEI